MTRSRCPDLHELLAFEDDELSPQRHAELHLHIGQCDDCQTRLQEMREVGRLVRNSAPTATDPEGIALLKERLVSMPAHAPGRQARRARLMATTVVAVSLALIATLSVSVYSSRSVAVGGDSFARWLTSGQFIERITPREDPAQQPVVPPPGVPQSANLPHGLEQVGEDVHREDSVERHYRSADGVAILFSADRSDSATIMQTTRPGGSQRIVIDGREVIVSYGRTSANVVAMTWVDGDVLLHVIILEPANDGLTLELAEEIASALMTVDLRLP